MTDLRHPILALLCTAVLGVGLQDVGFASPVHRKGNTPSQFSRETPTVRSQVHLGEKGALHFEGRLSITLQRTLRIPDDGTEYPLPPGLGELPIYRVEDYASRLPAQWKHSNAYFVPMYQREALWISFDGSARALHAVKVGAGRVNVLDGTTWDHSLTTRPQNYLVAPEQPWLDGFKSAEGSVRQFVAMPLGEGYTVEAQVKGSEQTGGLQIAIFDPKPGRLAQSLADGRMRGLTTPGTEMGLAAGGTVAQKVFTDARGSDVWDTSRVTEITIYIVNTEQFRAITGQEPPASPVSAATYTKYQLPWFELYDEDRIDIGATPALKNVKGIHQLDDEKGKAADPADAHLEVPERSIITIGSPR